MHFDVFQCLSGEIYTLNNYHLGAGIRKPSTQSKVQLTNVFLIVLDFVLVNRSYVVVKLY